MHKLEIFGPYPPPIGGISIHLERMEFFLNRENITYVIYNHGFASRKNVIATNKSLWWYVKYMFKKDAYLVHFHQFFKFHFAYYLVFSILNKRKLIITIHEENLLFYNTILKNVIVLLIRLTRYSELITVSKNLSDFLTERKILNTLIPAYVPPAKIEPKILPKSTKKYFGYSVWKVNREIGTKTYNIELAFRLLSKIQDHYQMLFLIGTEAESDKSYLDELISKYSTQNSITIKYECSLVEYLPNCQFFLRTNNVDGYGVSLQEALYLNVPAIASNVCIRPKGTILFQKDELSDLLDKVNNIEKYWDIDSIEALNYHLQLVELYKKHLC